MIQRHRSQDYYLLHAHLISQVLSGYWWENDTYANDQSLYFSRFDSGRRKTALGLSHRARSSVQHLRLQAHGNVPVVQSRDQPPGRPQMHRKLVVLNNAGRDGANRRTANYNSLLNYT